MFEKHCNVILTNQFAFIVSDQIYCLLCQFLATFCIAESWRGLAECQIIVIYKSATVKQKNQILDFLHFLSYHIFVRVSQFMPFIVLYLILF